MSQTFQNTHSGGGVIVSSPRKASIYAVEESNLVHILEDVASKQHYWEGRVDPITRMPYKSATPGASKLDT